MNIVCVYPTVKFMKFVNYQQPVHNRVEYLSENILTDNN